MNWWKARSKLGKLAVLFVVLVFGCGLLSMLQPGDGEETVQAPAVQTEAAGGPTAPPPTPLPTTPPWGEIEAFRDRATDAQWESYVKSAVVGSEIEGWDGYVYEVTTSGNEYRVAIDLEDPTDEIIAVAEINTKTDNADAINWFKGTPVIFSGRIKDASYGFGVISSVELVDATISVQ